MLHKEGVSENANKLWSRFFDKYSALEKQLCAKIDYPLLPQALAVSSLESLESALKDGNWDHNVFQETYLPHYALTLYNQGKITYHQFCTTMERWQTFKDFPHIKTYKMLNDHGEFTPEAETILFACLKKHQYLKELSANQLQELKELIASLPPSEQIFYTTEVGKLKQGNLSLGHTLLDLDVIMKDGDQLLHTSTGVFDAIGLVRFGLDNYIRPVHRLGAQNVDDIEAGVRADARVTALNFPGTVPYGDIHGYDEVTNFEATMHDKYHAYVLSAMPKAIVHALWYMVDRIREETKMKWSKEIWTFIDCELNSSYGRQKTSKDTPLSDDEMTKLFCLSVKAGNNTIVQSNSYGSLMLGGKPSALFILVILDMYQHPENWIQYQINPELLSERFKDYYKGEIASIYSDIKENPLLIQLLKCQLSYYLNEEMEGGYKEAYIKRQRKALFDIIDRNKISILSKLEFKKIIKPASDLVKMTIKPSEENLAEIKGVSSSTFVLVGNEFFYIDKRQEICKQIPVNSTQVESLVKLFKEGEEVRKLTPEEKKKIEAITGFAQPSEKGENCLTLTYAGKRLEKDMLANILYNDYAARYPDHREKARKKYVYAITELHCSPSEAEGEAANYAAKKEVSSTIGTLFCQPVVAAEGVTKIAEAIPETTFGYGT